MNDLGPTGKLHLKSQLHLNLSDATSECGINAPNNTAKCQLLDYEIEEDDERIACYYQCPAVHLNLIQLENFAVNLRKGTTHCAVVLRDVIKYNITFVVGNGTISLQEVQDIYRYANVSENIRRFNTRYQGALSYQINVPMDPKPSKLEPDWLMSIKLIRELNDSTIRRISNVHQLTIGTYNAHPKVVYVRGYTVIKDPTSFCENVLRYAFTKLVRHRTICNDHMHRIDRFHTEWVLNAALWMREMPSTNIDLMLHSIHETLIPESSQCKHIFTLQSLKVKGIVVFIRATKVNVFGQTKDTLCFWIMGKFVNQIITCKLSDVQDQHQELIKIFLFIDPNSTTIVPRGPHYSQSFLLEVTKILHAGRNGCIFSIRYPMFNRHSMTPYEAIPEI